MRRSELLPGHAFALKRRWHTSCYVNLNKLEWFGGFGVTWHGVRIGIRVSDPSLIPQLEARLPAGVKPCDGGAFDCVLSMILGGQQPGSRLRRFHLLYHDHDQVCRSHNLGDVLERFDAVMRMSVGFLATRRVFVHAGAVAWNGRAIIIPGRTLSGKSTLVTELVRAGAIYMSDEYAVLDGEGRVYPFPKPISLRAEPTAKQMDIPVETIGGTVARKSMPAGLVLISTYKAAARWRPRQLTPGEGVLAMLSHTLAGRLAPTRVFKALESVAATAPVVKSARGEAAEIVPQILWQLEHGQSAIHQH
jgi:hypothetical protein